MTGKYGSSGVTAEPPIDPGFLRAASPTVFDEIIKQQRAEAEKRLRRAAATYFLLQLAKLDRVNLPRIRLAQSISELLVWLAFYVDRRRKYTLAFSR